MAERRIINGYIVERQPDGRLVTIGPAGGTAPQMPTNPTFPYEGPKAAADLTKTVTDNEIAIATKGDAIRKAKADADKAEADALKAARDAATATTPAELQKARAAQVQAAKGLHNQLDRVEDLYDKNFRNNGLGAIGEFNPWSQANRQFDAAANILMPFVKPLARVPGEGATDKSEYQDYRDLLPSGTSFDSTNDEHILGLREMANSILRENGLPEYTRPKPEEKRSDAPLAAGNIPPALQGPDRSNPIPRGPVDPNFDPTGKLTLGTGRFATDRDKQVQQQLNAMLNSGATEEQLLQAVTSTGYAPYYNLGKIREVVQYRDRGGKGAGFALPTTGERSAFEKGVNTALTWEDPYIGFSPGTAAASGVNALGAGTLEAIAPQAFDEMRANNPVSAFTGDVAGIVGATSAIGKIGAKVANRFAPQALTAGGRFGNAVRSVAPDAVYGAAYGGITEGDPLTGAATAAAGSGAGQLLGKGAQKLFQGVSDHAVRYLSDKGIPLTLGQIMGNRGIVGKGLNAAESHPVIGPLLGAGRDRSLIGWNKAKLNEIIEPVGGNVTSAGSEGLEQAQQAVGQGFRNALDGVTVSPDAQFISEAQAAMQAGAAVPKFGEDFTYVMNQEVGPIFGQGGQLTGPQLQNAMQALGKIQGDFNRNPEALATYAGNAAGQVDDALTGLVNRQAPDVMPAYDSAKQAFSQLVPFENAAISAINSRAGEGIVTPTQYIRAMTNNTKNYGGRAAAARGKNLTDLDRFGQEVLPSTVPETGARLAAILPFVPTGLLAGGSAAAGMNGGDATTVGSLAALAALTSPLGARLAQHALVTRPEPVRRLGGIFGGRKAKKGLSSIGVAAAPLLIGQ